MIPGRHDSTVGPGHLSAEAAQLADMTRRLQPALSDIERASDWRQVEARLSRPPRKVARLAWLVGAGAMVAASLVWLVFGRVVQSPLALEVVGGKLADNGHVSVDAEVGATLRFSDGSVVGLDRNAVGRVGAIGPRGATVQLERGRATVHVVPRPAAQWLFDAGPFRVDVKGTSFDLDWQPADGRLQVLLRRGEIVVTGPLPDAPITLHGRQILTVDVPRHEVRIRDDVVEAARSEGAAAAAAAAATTAMPTSSGGAVVGRAVVQPVVQPAPGRSATAPLGWAALLASGKLDRILADAESSGLDGALARRSSQELAALADAARYRGRDDVARRALLAQRQRFAGSSRSIEAAFLLGRIEESGGGNAERALGWYDRYLDEAPSGIYAAEVLGRKMLVVQQLYGRERAAAVAQEYLRRYPSGSYAALARKLADR